MPYHISFLRIDFVLANSADHDEMRHFIWVFAVCEVPVLGFLVFEGLNSILWLLYVNKNDLNLAYFEKGHCNT